MTVETIDTAMARELIKAHAVQSTRIVGRPGGWSVVLKLGVSEKWLAAQRSKLIRVWRSLDRCVAFMRGELGLAKFDGLDASRYSSQGSAPRVRTDAAARMRHAHEAAAHDRWFRAQVTEGLRELDAGRTVSEEVHSRDWARRRAALQKQIAAKYEA